MQLHANYYTKDIKKNGRGYILADSAIIDGPVWSQSLIIIIIIIIIMVSQHIQ